METNNPGTDYGMGTTNSDTNTGIRFGVISYHDVLQAWADSSEPNYGDPHCPKCGNATVHSTDESVSDFDECADYYCDGCRYAFDASDAYGDEPVEWRLDDGEYLATQSGDDADIFIIRSPYYTHAQFCSPCAPGAGYLGSSCAGGPRTYCFGHDWFDDGRAPYPVYRVADGSVVNP
jgi:ribosomal protein L37AE/L43A